MLMWMGWRDFVIVFGIFKNRTHIRLHFVKNKSFQFQFAFSTKVVTNIHLFLAVHSWDKNENQKQRRQSHQLHFFWWVSWEKKEMVELPPLHVSLSFVTVYMITACTNQGNILHYYSFKIFLNFWWAKIKCIIHHNKLSSAKFGRILPYWTDDVKSAAKL